MAHTSALVVLHQIAVFSKLLRVLQVTFIQPLSFLPLFVFSLTAFFLSLSSLSLSARLRSVANLLHRSKSAMLQLSIPPISSMRAPALCM